MAGEQEAARRRWIARVLGIDLPGSAARGTLTGSLDDLTAEERRYAAEQVAAGHDVEIVPRGAGRTPDFTIDGVRTELKTLSGAEARTADRLSAAVSSRIMDARGQSGAIVVDARGQRGMTQAIAARGVRRAVGADNLSGGRIRSITVLAPDGTASFRRE